MPRALAAFLALALPALASAQVNVSVEIRVAPNVSPVVLPFVPLPTLQAIGAASVLPQSSVASIPVISRVVSATPRVARASGLAGAATPARPLRLAITGPPGSGKGTYAKRLETEYGAVHISAGALLRVYAEAHPSVKEIMDKGELVPAELVIRLIRERLSQDDVRAKGFILDGFPRRLEEARALAEILDGLGMPIDAVVFLDVPEAELLRRVLARGRDDDNEATFRERMRVYREETVPVFEALRARAPFLSPSVASGDPDAAYAEVRRAVDSVR